MRVDRHQLVCSTIAVVAMVSVLAATSATLAQARRRGSSGPADHVVAADKPFIDDFDGKEIDRTKWNIEVTGRTVNNEQQAYIDSGEVLYIVQDGPLAEGKESGGVLVFHPRFRDNYSSEATRGREYDFVSGRINTRGRVEFTHGSASARIRMTEGAGLWPAFWLLGNGRWPDTGEIDIMEYVGDKTWVSQAVHGPGYSGNTPIVNRTTMAADADATAWHVYSVDWTATEMVFRIDGEAVYQVTKEMIEKHGRWVFDEPKHVIVNFALGGGYPQGVNRVERPYPGLPESTVEIIKADGAVYLVDWVRVTKG